MVPKESRFFPKGTHIRVEKYLLPLLLALLPLVGLRAQQHTTERAQWFVEDRFGMFIHWGLYSGAEGFWKGEKLRYDNEYAEWIQYRNRIDTSAYTTLAQRFDWDKIDVEEWVLLAKKAGMQYITLTAKHHDGFALWDSKVSTYNVSTYSKPKRDIVAELIAACRKHNLKVGLYYSHWIDWEHPNGWDHTKEINPISPEEFNTYWESKVMPQMRELLTQYGAIDLIWFDMWINHTETIISKQQLVALKNMIRTLQPNCLVNSRLGLSLEEDPDVDFRTMGDNQLGGQKLDYPWQTPATVAHSWGFNAYEDAYKSTTALLKGLIGNVALNGNYMLNIGPRANGDVPYEVSQRLEAMGKWLETNGASIYGSAGFDLPVDQHGWGKMTFKEGNQKSELFLHVYTWPLNGVLPVTGITSQPTKVYLLADKKKSPLDFVQRGPYLEIQLPDNAPDPYVSVLVAEYKGYPKIQEDLVGRSVYGDYTLSISNTISKPKKAVVVPAAKFGSIPPHVLLNEPQQLQWTIFVEEPMVLEANLSYAAAGEGPLGSISFDNGGMHITRELNDTGLTVGEPNEDWVIPNFTTQPMGNMAFDKAGFYTLTVIWKPIKNGQIKFNWLTLTKQYDE